DRFVAGDIVFGVSAPQGLGNGRPLEMRQRGFVLLHLLLAHTGGAMKRPPLLDHVWGPEWGGDPRALAGDMPGLREKVEDDPSAPRYIQTVRGYGYRLVHPYAPPFSTP